MVAVLVRLKLSLLRNTLLRSHIRILGLVVQLLFAVVAVTLSLTGLIAARSLAPEQAELAVVLGGAALIAGWTVMPVLLSGADETLDTSRFVLLPLSARQLLPGLLIAGSVGVPGVATTLIALATVATWLRGPFVAATALLAALLGILTCLLSARVITSALAGLMASRRFKDLASLAVALLFIGFAVGSNALSLAASAAPEQSGQRIREVTTILGWTPLGWAWSAPVAAATGSPVIALTKLVLAAGFVAALTLAWHHFLTVRLTTLVTVASSSVRPGTRLERLLPAGPTGATALRCLRYWRRDPRYLASVAGVLIAPFAVTLANVVSGGIGSWLAWMPILLAFVIGVSTSQDLSYDGSSLWTQISTGVPGRVDLAGRALAMFFWAIPLLVTVIAVSAYVTDSYSTLPPVIGLSSALALGGVGIGLAFSAHFQGPAPPPGANPFSSGSGSSFHSFLSVFGTMVLSLCAAIPILVLVIGGTWMPALNWAALVLGPLWGLGVLILSLRIGGAYLDGHWPEVLARVIKHSD